MTKVYQEVDKDVADWIKDTRWSSTSEGTFSEYYNITNYVL